MSFTRLRGSIGEIAGGAVLFVLGTVWAVVSSDYGVAGDGGRLAPGTLPFVCGVGLALSGAFIAVKAIVKPGERVASDAEAGPSGDILDETAASTTTLTAKQRMLAVPKTYPIATVYGLVVLAVLAMPIIGFAIAFACGIFGILRLVEHQSIRTSALVAVITALLGYALFEVIFNLPLPEPFFL